MTTATLHPEAADPALGSAQGAVTISFVAGMPGFPQLRSFELRDLGAELAPFAQLVSLEADLTFIVVPPGRVFPDYTVELTEEHVSALGLAGDGSDAAVLCIVSIAPPDRHTVNLLGPIVVNRRTGAAAQVVQAKAHPATAATPLRAAQG